MTDGDHGSVNEGARHAPLAYADTEAADARIGTVVDKYRITRLLGRGGMGSVYEAHHVLLERRFAVKFMLPEYASNRETLRRFENEAKAAGQLEHGNIAAVTDFGRASDGSPYLVMEYLTGQDCARLLSREGTLAVQRAADIAYQACMGLAVAHKAGIVHRDIKPENLFITDGGDNIDIVKVLDFGIAKLRLPDASAVTGSGVAMGTFFYMAPEQVRDSGKVDARADVWALGVVLYELLTGHKPFDGTDATKIMYQIVFEAPTAIDSIRPDVPQKIAAIIDCALRKDANERFSSVAAMADALAPYTGRTSRRPPSLLASENPPPGATAFRATTSHASVATLTNPSGTATSPKNTKVLRPSFGVLLAVGVAVGAAYWTLKHKAAPTSASSADGASPAVSTAMLVASAAPLAPSALPADSGATTATSNSPAAIGIGASDVQGKFERSLPTSNKPRANAKSAPASQANTPTPLAPSALTPLPKEDVPDKPKSNTHRPLVIDTSSPY